MDLQVKPDRSITLVRRSLWAALAFLGFYALTALPLVFIFGIRGWTFGVPLAVALAAAIYVWARVDTGPGEIARPVLGGAIVFGVVGFAVGFLGPAILAPGANQGPLLGIFITGPAGIVVGAVAGLVYALEKPRRK